MGHCYLRRSCKNFQMGVRAEARFKNIERDL
jgi:hypothetical protein